MWTRGRRILFQPIRINRYIIWRFNLFTLIIAQAVFWTSVVFLINSMFFDLTSQKIKKKVAVTSGEWSTWSIFVVWLVGIYVYLWLSFRQGQGIDIPICIAGPRKVYACFTCITNPLTLSLIHIWRCRRSTLCRSRWSPYH